MATSSVPTLNMSSRWGDTQQGSSQSSNKNNTSLEMAMSGMNIVSSFGTSPVEFSASPEMQSDFSEELNGHQRKHIIDSGDSVQSQRSNNSNASPLPSKPIHRLHGVPPIGRPGHSKSSSISTSQSLTLTPTSSVDGTDIHDYNKRNKEEQQPPTRITTTMGDGFDGIHGARDRANTAPGTMGFPSSLDTSFGSSSGHRPRSGSREGSRNQLPSNRPPLAGAPSYNPESSALGTISRPGYPPHSGDFLQRSTSDSAALLSSAYTGQMEQQSNKLSSFPSLPQQSGLNPNQPSFQPISKHLRSLSGGVPDYMNQFQHHPEPPMGHTRQVSDFGVSSSDHGFRPPPMRYRNHSFGSAEEVTRADLHRRSSLQTLPNAGGYYGQNPHDRNSLDYNQGHDMFANDFGPAGHVSPGHSPLHQHYGHHRAASLNAPPPMAMGGGGGMRTIGGKRNSYGNHPPRHHRVPSLDDDLSHPLAGESIDVPPDDRGYMLDSSSHSVPSLRSGSAESSQYMPAETAQHLPTAGASLPLAKVVYSVKFKRTQRSFVIGPRLNRDLKIGTYVKVEADRGEDLGIVVGKVSPEKRSYRGGDMSIMPPATAGNASDLKRIIRLATHDEVSLLSLKREEEDELLKICRTKVRQRSLPMNVVDAEYQFDRHKLTFFFEAEGRVDFRELVRDLFSIYKTRIWMQQLDKNTSNACRAASNPPAPVVMDFGTPIIAPMSEFREFMTE